MSDEEQKRFEKMTIRDKVPKAPRKFGTSYFWFCTEERVKIKAQNPEYNIGDIALECGRRWIVADLAKKSKYEAMAEEDKARYQKELIEYEKKAGRE